MDIENIIKPTFYGFDDNENRDFDIHISSQKRNGKKSWTFIENFDKIDDDANFLKNSLRTLKEKFSCNALIKEGNIIQMQGDHRMDLKDFISTKYGIKKENIKVHGS